MPLLDAGWIGVQQKSYCFTVDEGIVVGARIVTTMSEWGVWGGVGQWGVWGGVGQWGV